MKSPELQNAIKLIDFCVEKINMDRANYYDKLEAESFNLEIGLGLGFSENNLRNYNVSYDVVILNPENGFELKVRAIATFETRDDITEEFRESGLVRVNSPAIGFPYIRSFITTLTSNTGISPIILPAYNFTTASVQTAED